MADPIRMILTTAGLDALVDAQAGETDAIKVTEVGLTAAPFDAAPTLEVLPGEFKRLNTVSGQSISPTVIHMTAIDPAGVDYIVRGVGLYLEDGTLFATYGQETPIFKKVTIAHFLLALDIAFTGTVEGDIVFGDALFLNPPASETVLGVARIATQAQTDAGLDDATIVTPKKLKTRLDALLAVVNAAITATSDALAALLARTITGAGLATGGGNLTANRVITVTEASGADMTAGTSTTTVVTPRRLGPIAMLLAQNGYIRFFGMQIAWGRVSAGANGATAVIFATAFPTACFAAVASGWGGGGADAKDNPPVVQGDTIHSGGFSIYNADDAAATTSYIAVGY